MLTFLRGMQYFVYWVCSVSAEFKMSLGLIYKLGCSEFSSVNYLGCNFVMLIFISLIVVPASVKNNFFTGTNGHVQEDREACCFGVRYVPRLSG